MLLSQMPIDEIRKKMPRVQSLITKRTGKVAWVSDGPDRNDYDIGVDWDPIGDKPAEQNFAWHAWYDKVVVIEED